MKKLSFVKMVASGNDFVVAELKGLSGAKTKMIARALCDRKYGIGADGLLALGPSKKADVNMGVFNADGSEADMCGNGARCVALYMHQVCHQGRAITIETKAGIIESKVSNDSIKVKLTEPSVGKLGVPLVVRKTLHVDCIDTGVPHAVIFVEGLDLIDIETIGRQVRYHRKFAPAGTNVNFVEIAGPSAIKVRTYERGIEGETLACGTGSVASALIFALKSGARNKICVHTKGGEMLTVYFEKNNRGFTNVWLEGKARTVFSGNSYI